MECTYSGSVCSWADQGSIHVPFTVTDHTTYHMLDLNSSTNQSIGNFYFRVRPIFGAYLYVDDPV